MDKSYNTFVLLIDTFFIKKPSFNHLHNLMQMIERRLVFFLQLL